MKFVKRLPANSVFLLPVVASLVGLIAVSAANERAKADYDARFKERFESDAALRLLVRESAIGAANKDIDALMSIIRARSQSGVDIFEDAATRSLVTQFSRNLLEQNFHIFIASVSDNDQVFIEFASPAIELVGREISQHPMLENFDVSLSPPYIDQIAYRASPQNDLSFTSDGPLVARRFLVALPNLDKRVILIAKLNSYEMQRAIDGLVREVGPIPRLTYTLVDPATDECLLAYVTGVGEKPCLPEDQSIVDAVVSERFGGLAYVKPTEAYAQGFEGGRVPFAYTELFVTLIASMVTLAIAVVYRRRLGDAERQLLAYKGALASKGELTTALHSMVIDNLARVSSLARRVKGADGIDTNERRYLNIALSEIGQLRLSLDAQIMADTQGSKEFKALTEMGGIDTRRLCRGVRRELERLVNDEGIECRLLADDELPGTLPGSQYWVESAILALINASQSFTDEGFIEVSIWVETSMTGLAELYVRCRHTGISWTCEANAEHTAVSILVDILSGLGAQLNSKSLQSGAGQEHFLHFPQS